MRFWRTFILVCLAFTLTSFSVHKFYVSIYQVNYSPSKQRLEITTRIFIDDLATAIGERYGTKCYLGEEKESPADAALVQRYLKEHFKIAVNGKNLPLEYLNREFDGMVFIGYFRIRDIPKVRKLEIRNTALTDYVTEQQNIIQTNLRGVRKSAILTVDNPVVKFEY